MKTMRWIIGLVLFAILLAGAVTRYQYAPEGILRVDRWTGRVEVWDCHLYAAAPKRPPNCWTDLRR